MLCSLSKLNFEKFKALRYIKVIFQSNFAHSVLSTVIFAGDQHNQLRKTQKPGRLFFKSAELFQKVAELFGLTGREPRLGPGNSGLRLEAEHFCA